MRKKYNVFIIARLYLKRYYDFVVKHTSITKSADAYKLYLYSMKKLYGLETTEYCKCIETYGERCVQYLAETPDTPKVRKRIPYEDKVRLISICEGYAQITGMLTYRYIKNGRLED